MSDVRWRGLSHQELYDSIWTGPGPQLSANAQKIWRDAGQRITEINNDLTRKLNELVATFDGEAAVATTRSLRPLEDWQEEARQAANRTANGLQYQADDIAKARNGMPQPEPSGWPEWPSWLGDPTGGVDPFFLEDWYAADVRESDAAAQAVYVMETYEQSSALNRDLIQPVATPPTVTNDVGISVARASGNPFAGFAGLAATAGVGFAAGAAAPIPTGGEAVSTPPPSAPPASSPTAAAPGVGSGLVPVPPGAVAGPPGAGTGGTRPGVGVGQGIPPRPTGVGFGGLAEPGGAVRPPGPFPGGIGSGGIGPGGIGPGGVAPGGISPSGAGAGGLGPGGTGGLGPGTGTGTSPGGTPSSIPPSTNAATNGRPIGSSPGFFPGLGAGAAGGGAREHRRPSYLVDDTDAFGDHRWITSGVLTPNDRPPRRRVLDDY